MSKLKKQEPKTGVSFQIFRFIDATAMLGASTKTANPGNRRKFGVCPEFSAQCSQLHLVSPFSVDSLVHYLLLKYCLLSQLEDGSVPISISAVSRVNRSGKYSNEEQNKGQTSVRSPSIQWIKHRHLAPRHRNFRPQKNTRANQ